MKLPVPEHLTEEEARLAIRLLEAVIDALIELHTAMRRLYHPWGEPQPDGWDDELPF